MELMELVEITISENTELLVIKTKYMELVDQGAAGDVTLCKELELWLRYGAAAGVEVRQEAANQRRMRRS